MGSKVTITDIEKELLQKELNEREELEHLKSDFWAYAKYWDSEFFYDYKFLLKQIAEILQAVEAGEFDYVIISIYPRAGKSYLISLFCSWMLGKYNRDSIMRNTYGASLYEKFSYDIRDMVQDKRFKKIFDDTHLSARRTSLDGWALSTSKQHAYFGAGFGGACTGFGANLLAIVDDPFKNMAEALSPTIRDSVWDWYKSVHRTRKEDTGTRKKCAEIVIGTRWHKEDLIGKLIETEGRVEEGGRWKVFEFPALDENDKSTCEAMKATEELIAERDSLLLSEQGFIWYSEYQQQPADKYGNMFPAESLTYFDYTIFEEQGKFIGCPSIGYCDFADEGDDLLASVIGVFFEEHLFIIDIIYTKVPYEKSKTLIVEQIKAFRPDLFTIEANKEGRIVKVEIEAEINRYNDEIKIKIANGEATVADLIGTRFSSRNNSKNKEARIFLSSGTIVTKMAFRSDSAKNIYYRNAIKHLTNFLVDGRNEHDDIEDCLAGLAQGIKDRRQLYVRVFGNK